MIKKLYKRIVNRLTFILIFLMLQIALFFAVIYYFSEMLWQLNTFFIIVSAIIIFFLLVKEENPYYKVKWIIPILLFPVFGGVFYLLYRFRNLNPKTLNQHHEIERNRHYFVDNLNAASQSREARYLKRFGWPSYTETTPHFLDSGEAFFDALLNDIKQAERFIFIEFFIIRPGKMWDALLKLLKEKASEGVEVVVIYDDFGSAAFSRKYPKTLKKYNIEVHIFNPIKLRLNFGGNYRDHRKITVIDGKIGYAVGNNIADEYINVVRPHGEWADSGIRLEGRAVWSLTLAFLDVLSFITPSSRDYNSYYNDHKTMSDGTVIPFAETPLDNEEVTKSLFLHLINNAQHSISITTPYLIIDPEMKNALRHAAKSGVDVSIIIPKIPDKKIVYMVTESHLSLLLKDGVKIYKYTPGFMHAKMVIIDSQKAVIGSTNFDYRSLYLHFENGVYLENSTAIEAMDNYFIKSMERSKIIEEDDKYSLFYRFFQMFFRMFAGLM